MFIRIAALVFTLSLCLRADTMFGSAYGFEWGRTSGHGVNHALYIDGPEGREIFDFPFQVEHYGDSVINRYGQLAGYAEATPDPFIYFAIYGHGGDNGDHFYAGHGAGYIDSVPEGVYFGSLGWLEPPPDSEGWRRTGAEILDVTDSGLVVGRLIDSYFSPKDERYRDVTWQLPNPVPEPGAVWLLGTAAGSVLWTLRRRRAPR